MRFCRKTEEVSAHPCLPCVRGIERPKNSTVCCFKRDRAGRPPSVAESRRGCPIGEPLEREFLAAWPKTHRRPRKRPPAAPRWDSQNPRGLVAPAIHCRRDCLTQETSLLHTLRATRSFRSAERSEAEAPAHLAVRGRNPRLPQAVARGAIGFWLQAAVS